ncbi:hypothetical protein V2A18_24075, partial [Pseudomonas aeruginosa]
MSVRISVESLSGCAWNGCPSQRGIRSSNTLAVDHHLRIAEALLLVRAKENTLGQTANAGENIRRLQLLPGGWRGQNASHQKV